MGLIRMISLLMTSIMLQIIIAEVKYTEYYVKLKDPWNVTCNSLFNPSTSWYFKSSLHYFDHYLFTHERIDEILKDRYSIKISEDRSLNTLGVESTDKFHAGYYGFYPDASTLENREFFKLILIANAMAELTFSMEEKKHHTEDEQNFVTLKINISYLGFKTPQPTFECTFKYGNITMKEVTCSEAPDQFSNCTLEKSYGPDDEVPYSCRIYFKDRSLKVVLEEQLKIDSKKQIVYKNKMNSWNVSCNTSSNYPMIWFFDSASRPHLKNVTLYSNWITNVDYQERYKFHITNDNKIFSMILPIVDVNHAGTYQCAHRSSSHLVEKKINLVVVDYYDISLNPMSTTNMTILKITTSYMGFNVPTPQFVCTFQHEMETMNNTVCKELLTMRCHLSETYDNRNVAPDKCQIWFEDQLWYEMKFEDPTVGISYKTTISIIVSFISIVFVIIVPTGLIFFIMRKRSKKSKNVMSEYLLSSAGVNDVIENEDKFDSRLDTMRKDHGSIEKLIPKNVEDYDVGCINCQKCKLTKVNSQNNQNLKKSLSCPDLSKEFSLDFKIFSNKKTWRYNMLHSEQKKRTKLFHLLKTLHFVLSSKEHGNILNLFMQHITKFVNDNKAMATEPKTGQVLSYYIALITYLIENIHRSNVSWPWKKKVEEIKMFVGIGTNVHDFQFNNKYIKRRIAHITTHLIEMLNYCYEPHKLSLKNEKREVKSDGDNLNSESYEMYITKLLLLVNLSEKHPQMKKKVGGPSNALVSTQPHKPAKHTRPQK